MRILRLTPVIVSCLLILSPHTAHTRAADEETVREGGGLSPVWSVLLFEGLIAANSGIAAAAPEVYGVGGLLVTPLIPRGEDTVQDITAMSLWAGLCVYNIIAPSASDLSGKETFLHNVVGWHVIGAGLMIASALSGDDPPRDAPSPIAVSAGAAGIRASWTTRF